jgi:hypothetical protein
VIPKYFRSGHGPVPPLPSFFIIGPPRTGTSWLHGVLSQRAWLSHPTKETRFFDKHFDRGIPWYRSHYRRAVQGRPVGEVAPTYFASAEARERIAKLIPNAKIVCTFRNPADRVLSLYRLKRAYGLIPWSFDDALVQDPELLESSRYAKHLKEWCRTFGESHVMATVHDDIEADPQSYLDNLLDFLGIPRLKLTPALAQRVLTSEEMTQPRYYQWTRGAIVMADWAKRRQLDSLVATAKRIGGMRLFVGGGPPFPELSSTQRTKLQQLFRPEVDALESLLNRDFSSWK